MKLFSKFLYSFSNFSNYSCFLLNFNKFSLLVIFSKFERDLSFSILSEYFYEHFAALLWYLYPLDSNFSKQFQQKENPHSSHTDLAHLLVFSTIYSQLGHSFFAIFAVLIFCACCFKIYFSHYLDCSQVKGRWDSRSQC